MAISNANTMIVYDADKMGLAQLYQLRGRVGRSDRISYAYLMYDKDKVTMVMDHFAPNKDIKAFLHEDSELLPEEGVNIQLFFTDESADEPVISNMARKLDADFSISWAKLEDFRSHVYGSLVINIKEEDKEKITAYLDEVKVLWEVLN